MSFVGQDHITENKNADEKGKESNWSEIFCFLLHRILIVIRRVFLDKGAGNPVFYLFIHFAQ